MKHIHASSRDGCRNSVLQCCLQFTLRQFTLVRAKTQTNGIDFEDLLERILQSQGEPYGCSMSTGDIWEFDQAATGHAISICTSPIDHGPIKRAFGGLFEQFRNSMNQVTASWTVRNGHERHSVFMNPLAERHHVLSDHVCAVAIARDFVGEHDFSVRIHDRDGCHFRADCVDD